MIDLSQYGINSLRELYYNPSYDLLYEHETDPNLEGYERGL